MIEREPLPFRGPRRVPVRALLAMTVAAGTAAFLGVGLTRDIPGWITAFGAVLSAPLAAAWITLRARRRLIFVAPLLFAGGLLSALVEPPYPRDACLAYAPVVGAIVAVIFTAACAPLFTLVARAADRPSHDVLERVLVRLAAWLSVVGVGSAALNAWWGGSLSTLGAGGLTRSLLIVALGGGAATAILVLLRDAGRLRWITRLHRGSLAAWSVVRREDLPSADILSYVAPTDTDGAIAQRTVEGHAPFRSSETWTPLAWIPLDPSESKRLLRRRAFLAALLALVQGAGATALGVVAWRHRLPLSGVTGVAVGMYHACALLDDGTVRCWGWLLDRERDEGVSGETRYAPVAIAGIDDATQIAAALSFSCALRKGGTVACWGTSSGNATKAMEMPGLSAIVRIAAGEKHACALRQDGQVLCWGPVDFRGPLGTPVRRQPVPMRMPAGRAEAIGLTAGDGSACLQRTDGVFCWGGIGEAPESARRFWSSWDWRCRLDGAGMLSCEETRSRHTVELAGVESFAVGPFSVCAVRADRTAHCWGDFNDFGQLGDGTRRAHMTPAVVRR